jgi:NAD(P)H-dependent FMN reductase
MKSRGENKMKKLKILALVGGIAKNSINKKLFHAIENLDLENIEWIQFDITELPFFSQDLETSLPNVVAKFKSKIEESDGLFFVTPEYNRSIPGVLKNAIDWGTRPYGKNSWTEKRAALLGVTPGKPGTMAAQQHLRLILSAAGAVSMPQPEIYLSTKDTLSEDGSFATEKTKELIKKYIQTFGEWVNS